MLILSIIIFLFFLIQGIEIILGTRKIKLLADQKPGEKIAFPSVSLIIPACNEEETVEAALISKLELDYPDFELILINDRSTDKTGEILDQFARDHQKVKVIHVTELPEGWLGKNNALQKGAEIAGGELLLFTDADIIFDRSLLKRAVTYFIENKIDHLAATPRTEMPGEILPAFMSVFSFYFSVYAKPWKASDPKSNYHVGIGAFNLIKKSVYEKIGKHDKIKMRPDDDLKLGKLVKMNGFKQDLLFAHDLMSVKWYASVKELFNGLLKNSLTPFNYSIILALLSLPLQFVLNVFPFIAIFFTSGLTRLFFLITVIWILFLYQGSTKISGSKFWHAFLFPINSFIFILIQIRSVIYLLKNDGIDWRGTHYSLQKLKANKI